MVILYELKKLCKKGGDHYFVKYSLIEDTPRVIKKNRLVPDMITQPPNPNMVPACGINNSIRLAKRVKVANMIPRYFKGIGAIVSL